MAYTDLQIRAFTQIAYMDLEEGFLKNKGSADNPVPLSKLLSSKQYNQLKDMGITDAEINSWKISAVHNTNSENGFYACVIETSPGNAAVGFRGSEGMGDLDNVIHDWVHADLGLLNSTLTNQQAEVDVFLDKYKDMLGNYDNLTMTGHSLGGNLAEYATIVSDKYKLDDNIEQCVSMDGPGFSDEFIRKHKDQIDKMNDVMKHYRWSFVGALLNDLPGVDYHFLEVTNVEGEDEYNSFTRHSTIYVAVDENGNFIEGEQDDFSKFTSMVSEGIDHMPPIIGDVLVTVIGTIWIGGMWIKEQLIDENGLTTAGKIVVGTGLVALCTAIKVFGLGPVLLTILEVAAVLVVAVLAVIAIAVAFEVLYDIVTAAIDFICDTVQKVLEWTLINPRPEAVFDLAEELHCETASVYRIRARAVNKLVRLRYGAGE